MIGKPAEPVPEDASMDHPSGPRPLFPGRVDPLRHEDKGGSIHCIGLVNSQQQRLAPPGPRVQSQRAH
jgi:hypothetical protein